MDQQGRHDRDAAARAARGARRDGFITAVAGVQVPSAVPPPVRFAWHRRQVRAVAGGQVHLVVPVAGCPASDATDAALTRLLLQRWAAVPGLSVTSAAATIANAPSGESQALSVVVSAGGPEAAARFDDDAAGELLRAAVLQLVGGPGAGPPR